jgi:hypothetical protein
MNQWLVLKAEQSEIKNHAEAIKYCYQKIIFNQESTEAYMDCLSKLLKEETPKHFINTFKQLRSFSYGRSEWRWLDINEDILHDLPIEPPAVFWCWLICHPNGFVRELAIKKLRNTDTPQCLRFFLVTLNDYIDYLRELAVEQITNDHQQLSTDELFFCLPLIDRLKTLLYKENQIIYALFQQELLSQPQLLLNAQADLDRFIARSAFQWSFLLDGSYRKQTLKNGLKNSDRMILIWTFRELQTEARWEESYLDELLVHPHLVIRKLACEWCYNYHSEDPRMLEKLLDNATAIKQLVLKYVQRDFPKFDCRAYYLKYISTQSTNAIHGLALLQDIRDKEQMLEFRHAKQKKIRLSVLNWAACLPLEEQLPIYIDYLSDSSRDVRNKAVEPLIQHYSLAIKEQLLPLFKTKKEPYFQLLILNILEAQNRRDYFFDFLTLYKDAAGTRVKDEIEKRLRSWCLAWNQRFFLRFSLKDKIEIAYLVNKNHEHYSAEFMNRILDVIRKK